MDGVDFHERRFVCLTTEEYRRKIHRAYVHDSLWNANCFRANDDRGPRDSDDYPIARTPVERHRVFTGVWGKGTYNHHTCLTKWRDRYVVAFSNCEQDEERPGQRTMITFSDDLCAWSDPVVVAPGDKAKGVCRNTGGVYADDERIVVYVMTRWNMRPTDERGMTSYEGSEMRMDAYVSTDGTRWEEHRELVKDGWIFEGPRPTREGKLLVSGARDGQPLAYLWDPGNPAGAPEVCPMPKTDPDMSLFHAEASWYQLDSGRIMMFWRDEGATERLAFTASDDGGRTWMKCTVSDIPDSMSRVYAGRLDDGRYYLVGNTWPKLLDRMHFMLSISEDGKVFNDIFTLVDDPTTQRAFGLLKADGYQYPCCLAEEGRLLVGYSVNKEDIEVGVVDTTAI